MRTCVHAQRELGRAFGTAAAPHVCRTVCAAAHVVMAAPPLVVPAAVVYVVTRRIDRQRCAQLARDHEPPGQPVEHPSDAPGALDHPCSAGQRRVIRRLAPDPDRTTPSPSVAQHRLGPAVAQPHLFAYHKARKQLRQRVIMTAELRGVLQAAATELVGRAITFRGDLHVNIPHHLPEVTKSPAWQNVPKHEGRDRASRPLITLPQCKHLSFPAARPSLHIQRLALLLFEETM